MCRRWIGNCRITAMTFPSALDSTGLYGWATRAVGELNQRRAEINALNVFPVPDSDTGSNMAHTMEAALAEADKGGDVAAALALGSVRGARGNSGMVLSQVLRAVADSTSDSLVDAPIFAQAMDLAVELVDRAIAEPVEGTVISVLRAAAAASRDAVDTEQPLHPTVAATVTAARRALRDTPSQLAVLREAGVVDAGGAGLVILLECLLAEIEGTDVANVDMHVPDEQGPELEIMFFYHGDLEGLEEELRPMGNSLVIARASDDSGSVHIHSRVAGPVIEKAYALGDVSQLRLEVLPEYVAEIQSEQPVRRVVVVVPEGGMSELFSSVGATVLRPGTSLDDPSADDIVITNGLDIEAGAAQIIDNASFISGLAALSVYEVGHPDTAAMVETMRDVERSMRVAHPAEETLDSVRETAQQLLKEGGEQVSLLTSLPVDTAALEEELGVQVGAVTMANIATEVGVE